MMNQLLREDPKHRLPEHLAERLCHVSSRELNADGAYVLYWMRVAMRAHDNPALDVAAHLANALGLPLLVLQTLDDDHAFASDRLHTFALESLRDAQRELADRSIHFALELRARGGDLSTRPVFQRAAAVVTDEMPVQPHRATATELLAAYPACTVDASCIVPMTLSGHAPARAFEFRDATKALRAERLAKPWADVAPHLSTPFDDLGIGPVDLRTADAERIAELVSERDIDHLIGPVRDTPGGARAGYARWQAFAESGLQTYSEQRNEPTLPSGVSRMSPYLHLGCVSPFRVAREAHAAGASKYLDELLVWREVAWHFCYRTESVDSFQALPEWAQQTLNAHADDPRPRLPSWESLARAQSGDDLWDAAQRSLLVHGELHNNVRMTWGKAFLDWAATPAEALRLALDLNHRLALDGRDPASYGGILWCFGLFDRPFEPEQPIRGTVRPRPLAGHAARLNVDAWTKHVDRPAFAAGPVAVVGAGIAGLTCARSLQDHGVPVTVFEKARGPGGRLASRRSEAGIFDIGAQYFTVADRHFARYVAAWEHDGVVARWTGRFGAWTPGQAPVRHEPARPRYTGAPRMSALSRHLASGLADARCRTRVARAVRADNAWHLYDDDGAELGTYAHLVVALPAPQAATLLGDRDAAASASTQALVETIRGAQLAPCWTVMVAFDAPVAASVDAARVEGSPLAWVAREASKHGRDPGERWLLQASAAWSAQHIEDAPEAAAEQLVEALAALVKLPKVRSQTAHRWRFARVSQSAGAPCLADASAGLIVCGDWCLGPRVGAAWSSGAAAAGRLMGLLGQPATLAPSPLPEP